MNARSTVEAEHAARRWVVPATVIAAVLPFIGSILPSTIVGRRTGNRLSLLVQLDENATALIVAAILSAIGLLLMPVALWHLYKAIKARRPEFPSALRFLALIGPPLAAISQVGNQAVIVNAAGQFVGSGAQTLQRSEDLLASPARDVFGYLGLLGGFAMGGGIVVLAINAMRVGLLPKFVGYVGVFAGVFTVIPIVPSPIVLTFWLLALAFLFSGRWVGKVPPAWETGEAEPWPTLAEMREQAEREKAGGGLADRAPARRPDPVPAAAPEAPERPGAARRKRKKRR